MKKFMLDTDICSYLLRAAPPILQVHIIKHREDLVISSITGHELFYGAYKEKSQDLYRNIDLFLSFFSIVEWDLKAAELCGKLRSELEASGQVIGYADLMIAASAITGNYTLVTNNTKHFQHIPGLKLANWMEPKKSPD